MCIRDSHRLAAGNLSLNEDYPTPCQNAPSIHYVKLHKMDEHSKDDIEYNTLEVVVKALLHKIVFEKEACLLNTYCVGKTAKLQNRFTVQYDWEIGQSREFIVLQ